MTRPDSRRRYRYDVQQDEEVTFDITPVGASGGVTAAQNGKTIPKTGTPQHPTFTFTVTEGVGNVHVAMVEFSFFGNNADDARFEIMLKGSEGGEFDDIRAVKIDSARKAPAFTFEVVA